MEIGGYIELSQFMGTMLHSNAIALNSARNCLAYLIEAKGIIKIVLPKFLCASVEQVCKQYNLNIRYYSIGKDFLPQNLELQDEEWLYLVNYYGQVDNSIIEKIKKKHDRLIVDNVQAYFQEPVDAVDTIYTCRKYFGVPDGAFLYSDARILRDLKQDKSVDRMQHLLGRYEASAEEYYAAYADNENNFENLPLCRMSKITNNLLHAIDYKLVKAIRERNYLYLHSKLESLNKLELKSSVGPFMYPLYLSNGSKIRKVLQKKKIYIPTLWPDVFDLCDDIEIEYDMAQNILPLPCDQRYNLNDMEYIVEELRKCVKQEE